tara:strand:- start:1423 stop:2061 length:639 start_codon:yes stop_codon:yes gene_type:complete
MAGTKVPEVKIRDLDGVTEGWGGTGLHVDGDASFKSSVKVEGDAKLTGTTTISGAGAAQPFAPSLAGLTAVVQATGATTTGAANQLTIKNYTGAAAEVHTLPAAVEGVRYAVQLSKAVAGGVEKLGLDCAGTDVFKTGSTIESRDTNLVVYDTSTAGETLIQYTPVSSANNFAEAGSIFYFWCDTAGEWNVQLFPRANPAGTGLVGVIAFAS